MKRNTASSGLPLITIVVTALSSSSSLPFPRPTSYRNGYAAREGQTVALAGAEHLAHSNYIAYLVSSYVRTRYSGADTNFEAGVSPMSLAKLP